MRRVSAAVVGVGLAAFALGMFVGGRTSGVLSQKAVRSAPGSDQPSAGAVLEGLNLGSILVQCKPPNAVLVSEPPDPNTPSWSDAVDDESNLPLASAVAEWMGPTDVTEVRNAFLRLLREHYTGRNLICYGPGIRSADGHPGMALEMLRCDTPDGACAAMVGLAIHIRGDRCRISAQLIPARPWRVAR